MHEYALAEGVISTAVKSAVDEGHSIMSIEQNKVIEMNTDK